jgi:flagellar biosynthetic protein FliR
LGLLPLDRIMVAVPVFVRLLAFFYFDPLLGGRRVPFQAKVALALVFAFMISQAVPGRGLSVDMGAVELAASIAGEVMIGLSMGFMVRVVFAGIEMAGQVLGFQMGFSIVNVLDQTRDGQVSITGQFFDFMAVIFYLSINAHHFLFRAVVRSFEAVPALGFMGFRAGFPEFIIAHTGKMLVLAIVLAAPGIVTLFLLNCAIGLMARTFPQMNIFVIGFPITVMAGLMVVLTCMPFMGDVFIRAFDTAWKAVDSTIGFMS